MIRLIKQHNIQMGGLQFFNLIMRKTLNVLNIGVEIENSMLLCTLVMILYSIYPKGNMWKNEEPVFWVYQRKN